MQRGVTFFVVLQKIQIKNQKQCLSPEIMTQLLKEIYRLLNYDLLSVCITMQKRLSTFG